MMHSKKKTAALPFVLSFLSSVFKSIRFLKRWSENWEIKILFYLIIFHCGNSNFLHLWVTLATNDTVLLYFLSNYINYSSTDSNYTHLHGGTSWYTNLYSPTSILSASTRMDYSATWIKLNNMIMTSEKVKSDTRILEETFSLNAP